MDRYGRCPKCGKRCKAYIRDENMTKLAELILKYAEVKGYTGDKETLLLKIIRKSKDDKRTTP